MSHLSARDIWVTVTPSMAATEVARRMSWDSDFASRSSVYSFGTRTELKGLGDVPLLVGCKYEPSQARVMVVRESMLRVNSACVS